MNKKRIVGVALAVGACGVLAAAGMMLSKKSGAVIAILSTMSHFEYNA